MEKNYLPSKKFTSNILIIAGFLVFTFIVYKGTPFVKNIIIQNKAKSQFDNLLVKDLVIRDTNENGIADWEEELWGLDPTTNGPGNKEIILAKRKALAKSNGQSESDGTLTQNDKIARELFSVIMSLKQTNNLSTGAMDAIANAIGEKINAEEVADIYTKNNIQVVSTTPSSIRTYYNGLKALNKKYEGKDLGNELSFLAQGLQNKDPKLIKIVVGIGDSYRAFGKDLTSIPTPTSLVDTELQLANNYEKTAVSIGRMGDMLDNQISGMAAIEQYKRYNDALLNNLSGLTTFFQRNGILNNSN